MYKSSWRAHFDQATDVEAILESMYSNPAPPISPVWLSTLPLAELLPTETWDLTTDCLTFLTLFIYLFCKSAHAVFIVIISIRQQCPKHSPLAFTGL